jgi:hypothetical protein
MKFFGHADLQNNYAKQLRFEIENQFPTDTANMVGRIIFKDKRLYVCVEIASGVPAWVPLTNQINTYMHVQSDGSNIWNINHGLKSTMPLVQIYADSTNKMIIPDNIEVITQDVIQVTFGLGLAGRAIVMSGDITGTTPDNTVMTVSYVSQTTINIPHNLGRYPIVRVFIGNEEVQPLSITFPDLNNVTVTFSGPETGVIRIV